MSLGYDRCLFLSRTNLYRVGSTWRSLGRPAASLERITSSISATMTSTDSTLHEMGGAAAVARVSGSS